MDIGHAAPLFGAGRFEVRGTLGAGGAGVVYRAFDRQLQREVALKLLRKASGRDLFRFKREFRALADVAHPNLVTLHELHAVDGDWYFTMELIEGVSFIDWVRPSSTGAGPQRGRDDIVRSAADDARLRGALIQLADALIALHRADKLHRDLKPSNVLVTAQAEVKLLDFGLVAGISEGEPERLAVGTPVYMSPEQASDQPLGEASDWYAVGCMVYEALTGRRPFEGGAEEVMTRKQHELPPHPALISPGVAADLARLSMGLLAPTPEARPTGIALLAMLGATPSVPTHEIARRAPSHLFVGRTAELEQLGQAVADARRSGCAVLVKGVSGIGKSTLIRRFLRGLGVQVIRLEGRCFEREAVPFKMLDGVVDTLTAALLGLSAAELVALVPRDVGALVRLFPVVRRIAVFADAASGSIVPSDPQELRRRGFQALAGVLARLAHERPVAVFVDDAHWGDQDSATFLAELIHSATPGLLVLVAHRPEDYLGVVAQLRRPPGGRARRGDVRELALGPLSTPEATELVSELATDAMHGAAVVAAAAGSPLALTEMAGARELGPGVTMHELVRARVRRMPPEVQTMMAVSCVAARPLPVEIAAHAAGVLGGQDEATQLTAERLATVRQVGAHMILHPAHDHVRAAVLAGLDTEGRAGMHEAIARAFEAVQGPDQLDVLAVVEHWLAAGHPANAAHHAVTAAHRAEDALAFRRAAELYEIARTHGPWDAAGQRDLMRHQAHALMCAGHLDEAATVYGHAAELLTDDEAIDLERLRVEALLRRGRLDEALPVAEVLLEKIGLRIPLTARTSRSRLATQWMQMKLRGLDYVRHAETEVPSALLLAIDVLYSIASGLAFTDPALGRGVQGELIRAALDAGEPTRVCLALTQEICYAAAGGSRSQDAVDAVGERLKAIATELGDQEVIGLADAAIGIAAHTSGRWRAARTQLETGLATLRDHGSGVRWEIDIGNTYWLATLFYLGDWRALVSEARGLLRDAIDRGDLVAQQRLRGGRCNLSWLIRDQPDEARAQLELATATLGAGSRLARAHAVIAAANIDLYVGDAAGAAHRLRDAWAELERVGVLRMQQPRLELAWLRARIALADHARPVATRVEEARALAATLVDEGAAWATALGQLIGAAAAAWAGARELALSLLEVAEPRLVDAGMEPFVQLARIGRGQLLGGAWAARAVAATDQLRELGASDPDHMAAYLLPWPGRWPTG